MIVEEGYYFLPCSSMHQNDEYISYSETSQFQLQVLPQIHQLLQVGSYGNCVTKYELMRYTELR